MDYIEKPLVGRVSKHYLLPLRMTGRQIADLLSICSTPRPHTKHFFLFIVKPIFNDTAIFERHYIAWFCTTQRK